MKAWGTEMSREEGEGTRIRPVVLFTSDSRLPCFAIVTKEFYA